MPGNNGTTITVHGIFSCSDNCDREFQKIASKFGTKEELNALDVVTDHTKPSANVACNISFPSTRMCTTISSYTILDQLIPICR
jgi:hypothetical protein